MLAIIHYSDQAVTMILRRNFLNAKKTEALNIKINVGYVAKTTSSTTKTMLNRLALLML